jgi:hypothetical protein
MGRRSLDQLRTPLPWIKLSKDLLLHLAVRKMNTEHIVLLRVINNWVSML